MREGITRRRPSIKIRNQSSLAFNVIPVPDPPLDASKWTVPFDMWRWLIFLSIFCMVYGSEHN